MNVSATASTQQSTADLATNMSLQAESSISTSMASSLDAASFDNVDMMLAGMDSSMTSEQMMKLAIAMIILQMINGDMGGSAGESATDLLGMLAADSLLQSAGQSSANVSTETSINIQQTTSVNYAQNAYASLDTQDPNQQLTNVDVMI